MKLTASGNARRASLIGAFACALFVAACSDSAPPDGRGSLHVKIHASPLSQYAGQCKFRDDVAYIGGDSQQGIPDEYQLGTRVVDNQNGATVTCKVAGKNTYAISGRMRQNAVDFSVRGTVPPANYDAGDSGTGDITVLTSTTIGQVLVPITSDQKTCKLTPIKVQSGAIWAKFECDVLQASGQQNTYCGVDGFFVFENCEQ